MYANLAQHGFHQDCPVDDGFQNQAKNDSF